MKIRILTSLAVVLCAGPLAAQTPSQLVAEGRALLTQQNLNGAQAKFLAALTQNPNHPTANALAAATRLLLLPQQPATSNLLTRIGFAATGRDIFNWTNDFRRDASGNVILPPNLNSTEAIALVRSTVLPALRSSENNLARITGTNFLLTLTAEETGGEPLTLDYGDVQVFRALLHAGDFIALTLDTYNFSIVINRLQQLGEADLLSIERLLEEYPALLTLTTPAYLAAARTAMTNAMARYLDGSEFVRAARLPGTGLFTLDSEEDMADEAEFRDYLVKAWQSLDGPVKLNDEADVMLNLGRYFTRAAGLRELMPAFHGDRYVWNSLPSHNLDGMLLGASANRVEDFLREHLGSFEGFYVGQVEGWSGVEAEFAVFVNAEQRARVVGQRFDPVSGLVWSWPLSGDGEWEGESGPFTHQWVSFSSTGFEGYTCTTAPRWNCVPFMGERVADTGAFPDVAGFYSGTARSGDFTNQLRAIVLPDGTVFTSSLNDMGEADSGARARLDASGSFSAIFYPGEVQVTGTLNRASATLSGTFSEEGGMSGTFSLSRRDSVSPISGEPPEITTEPQDQTVPAGNTATFTVAATGSGRLYYQWYFNDAPLIASGRKPTLSVPQVNDLLGGGYSVVVSSPFGAVTSQVATLTVAPEMVPPTVTISQPPNGFVSTNGTVMLSGTASDNTRVDRVDFRVNDGVVQTAEGSSPWSAVVSLEPGTNRIEVWSVDGYGNVSVTRARLVESIVFSPLHLAIVPSNAGDVTGPTNGQSLILGRGYRVRAWPRPGFLFQDWGGDLRGTNARLNFLMQPDLMLQANFIENPFYPAQGAYAGLFYPTNGSVALTNSGGVSLTLTETGAFSGQLQFPAGAVPIAGQFGLDKRATLNVPTPAGPALTLQLELIEANRISGIVSGAAWEAELNSLRAATNVPALKGRYTLVLPGSTEAGEPPGNSGLTLRATRAGVVTILGWLGDGTLVQRTTSVSEDGWVPLFTPIYNGRGGLFGWQKLSVDPPLTTNDLSWLKAPRPAAKFYPLGFTIVDKAVLGRYVPPAGSTNALNWSQGDAVLGAGNLTNVVVQGLTVSSNKVTVSKPNPLRLNLTLTPTDGSFSGTIRNPATGQTNVTVRGVLLQPENIGAGSFLGTNESGYIRLGPPPG